MIVTVSFLFGATRTGGKRSDLTFRKNIETFFAKKG